MSNYHFYVTVFQDNLILICANVSHESNVMFGLQESDSLFGYAVGNCLLSMIYEFKHFIHDIYLYLSYFDNI